MQTKTKIKNKPAFLIGILMITIFAFAGCEKVINPNLVESKPQLVIEGLITDGTGPYTIKLSKTGSDGQQDARVEIHCFFRDPLEKNFYRAYIYTNGNRGYEDYKLYDDQYTNGKQTDLQVKRAHIRDIIRVDLFSLDKSTYEYYKTFNDLIHSNPIFGSTPMNPNTNLTNGALGFFGACAISTKTIIISDSLYNLSLIHISEPTRRTPI